MFELRTQRVTDGRIVSISQPHVRPIVRGKAGAKVEFGAKLSASLDGGYFFLDRLDWNNFNESKHLDLTSRNISISAGVTIRHRCMSIKSIAPKKTGNWCKEKGIRLSGPKLGRPLKNTPQNKEQILQNKALARQDEIDRIPIEGKFGQSKRRFGLDRVMTKLAITSQCVIAMTFLVINLEKGLRLLFLCLFYTHQLSVMTTQKPHEYTAQGKILLCSLPKLLIEKIENESSTGCIRNCDFFSKSYLATIYYDTVYNLNYI